MMKFSGALMILLMAALAAPAFARSGDMFEDDGISTQSRPRVNSDQNYGYANQSDVFGNQTPFVSQDKDMFDNTHPPPDLGLDRRFSARPQPPPQNSMFSPNAPQQ